MPKAVLGGRWVWPAVWTATLVLSAAVAVVSAPAGAGATPPAWVDATYAGTGVQWVAAQAPVASAVDGTGRAYVITTDPASGASTLRRLTPAGRPDTVFAGGGVALVGAEHALHVDADNRAVVASTIGDRLVVRRFAVDGSPDSDFGSGGSLTVALTGAAQGQPAVVARSGGVVVLVRTSGGSSLVAVTGAGALDGTWAPGERVPGVLALTEELAGIAGDGETLVGVGDARMLRFTATGTLDPDFGTGGAVELPPVPYFGVRVHAGAYFAYAYFGAAAIVKVTAAGELDPSFGVEGVATGVASECGGPPRDLIVTDAYLYTGATGSSECEVSAPLEVTRFTPDGELDTSYGDGGRLVVDSMDGRAISAGALAGVQPDGRLLVTVHGTVGGGTPLTGVVRLLGSPLAAGAFVPLSPVRVLDTRAGTGQAGALVAGATLDLPLAGLGGVPETGAAAVVLTVTVTEPVAAGFVTVYPTGGAVPTAWNVNFGSGQTVPNLVTVKLGANGSVSIVNGSAGAAHVVADVAGYYVSGEATEPGAFTALEPSRVLDTRVGTGAPAAPVVGNRTVTLPVAGRGGVPATGAAAVVLNVTVTDPQAAGFVTVYPSGGAAPRDANLTFGPGQTVANLVTVRLGEGGAISLRNSSLGTSQLIVDVAGYYLAGTATKPGMFVPLDSSRVLDTRDGLGPVAGHGTLTLTVTDVGGIPAGPVSAVLLTMAGTQTTAPGFVTVYPYGSRPPVASNLNLVAGQSLPNLVVAKVDGEKISIHNGAAGPTDLVADVAGYFVGVNPCPASC